MLLLRSSVLLPLSRASQIAEEALGSVPRDCAVGVEEDVKGGDMAGSKVVHPQHIDSKSGSIWDSNRGGKHGSCKGRPVPKGRCVHGAP